MSETIKVGTVAVESDSDDSDAGQQDDATSTTSSHDDLESNIVKQELRSSASWAKNVHSLTGFRSPLVIGKGGSSPLSVGTGRQTSARRAANNARQTQNFVNTSRALSGISEVLDAAPERSSGDVSTDTTAFDAEDVDFKVSDSSVVDDSVVGAREEDVESASSATIELPVVLSGGAPLQPLPTADERARSELQKWEALLARREEALVAREQAMSSSNARQRLVLQLRAQVEQRERVVAELQARLTETLGSVETAIHDAVSAERQKLVAMVESASSALDRLRSELTQRERAVEDGERALAERVASTDAALLKRISAAEEGIRLRNAQAARSLASAEKDLADRVEKTNEVLASRVAAVEAAIAARESDALSCERQARADLEAQRAALDEREAAFAARLAEARANGTAVAAGSQSSPSPGGFVNESSTPRGGAKQLVSLGQSSGSLWGELPRSFLNQGGAVAAAAVAVAVAAMAPLPPPGGTQMEMLSRRFGGLAASPGSAAPSPIGNPTLISSDSHITPAHNEPPFRMAGPTAYASAHPFMSLSRTLPHSPPSGDASRLYSSPLAAPAPATSTSFLSSPVPSLVPEELRSFAGRRAMGASASGTVSTASTSSVSSLSYGVAALLADPGSVRENRTPLARTEEWSAAEVVRRTQLNIT